MRDYILVQFRDQIRADAFKTRVSIENELRSAVYSCGGKIFAETDARPFRQNCRRVYVYIYTSFQNSIPIAIRETDDAVPSRFLVASLNLMPSPLRLPFYSDPRVGSPLWEIRSTANVRYIGHRK